MLIFFVIGMGIVPFVMADYDENVGESKDESVQWSVQFGNDSIDGGGGIAIDSLDNTYVTGYTDGNLFATNAGFADGFIAKYDINGNELWTKQFGGAFNDLASDITVDSLDNVYVVGITNGDLFETSAGNNDVFIVKYDINGNELWTKQFGSDSLDGTSNVSVDSLDNVYVAGSTGGDLFETSAGYDDVFIAKYDADGNELWAKQFGSYLRDPITDLTVDSLGNAYVIGYTNGKLFGKNAGEYDIFIVKYDTNGNELWAKQFGSSMLDVGGRVIVDSLDNVYVTGNTRGNLFATNAGEYDIFIAKYDADGNELWTKQFGSSMRDSHGGLTIDSFDNVYVAGSTNGDFFETNAGGYDAFIAKYDSNGNELWTKQFGSSMRDFGGNLVVDSLDDVYFTGNTRGDLFGINEGGFDDIFLLKYKSQIITSMSTVYPQPTTVIESESTCGAGTELVNGICKVLYTYEEPSEETSFFDKIFEFFKNLFN